MSDNSLEDVKKVIKSLVLAHQNGLSPISLNNEFIEVEGRPIPWKSFGASTLTEFLRSLNDILVDGFNKAQEQVFFARVDSSTAHIANFVAHQKPQTVKRRNNIFRNDLDKRPCREPNIPTFVPASPPSPPPPLHPPSPPHPLDRIRSKRPSVSGVNDRRREPERAERSDRRRQREPSPMSISPPPRRTPSPEPDRFRNPSPPRHGRSHSFRDASPDRPRRQSLRDANVSPPTAQSSLDYDKELQKARERRGLPAQSSRSRRSRSPSPRRHRFRPSPSPTPASRRSPPIQTKSVSCQADIVKASDKKLVSVSCQTDTINTEKADKADKAKPPATQPELVTIDENETDLNAAYYGNNGANYGFNYGANYGGNYGAPFGLNYANCPYNGASYAPIRDPSYEEDKSRPGFYYDFDAGMHKPIPLIPEYYANWIWNGWAQPTQAAPQSVNQQSHPSHPYLPHQPSLPSIPTPATAQVHLAPEAIPQQPLRVIPTTPTTPSNAAKRDPRLARQTAALAASSNNNDAIKANDKKASTVPPAPTTKRKALSVNDYMKTRKLGPDKPTEYIINEEAQETPETLSNSLDYYIKMGVKKN